MATLNRHQLRQAAFQSVFGLAMNPDTEVEAVVQQVLDGDPEITWEDELPTDLLDMVNGIIDHQDEFDLTISEHLADGWTLDRLNLADIVLMRLALYEVKYTETPAKIAVNEALQLAHDFTDDSSRKFINVILNKALTLGE